MNGPARIPPEPSAPPRDARSAAPLPRAWLRRNGIAAATLVIWAGLVAGTFVGIDLLLHQPEKKRLITAHTPEELFPVDLPPLMARGDEWQRLMQRGEPGAAFLAGLADAADAAVAGATRIRRIVITDAEGQVIHDVGSTGSRGADRRSSWGLGFDDPEIRYQRRIQASADAIDSASHASIQIHFTTPQPEETRITGEIARLRAEGRERAAGTLEQRLGTLKRLDADITALTRRYRGISFTAAGTLSVLLLLFMYWIVLPVRRVTAAIETLSSDRVRVLRSPRSLPERLYNEMAWGTSLARLQEELSAVISAAGARPDPPAILNAACAFLSAQDGIESAVWRTESGDRGPTEGGITVEIDDGMNAERRTVLEIRFGRGVAPGDAEAERRLADRIARIVSLSCAAMLAGSRTILRERQQANINLARNLGHDLTNVIAAGKLDLMTLGTVTQLEPGDLDAAKMKAVREALAGVIDTTRCLQEIVNLYRAYAFLREPTFESVSPCEVVTRTVELFRLIHSRNVGVRTELGDRVPECEVDPRLLQLALFNLLANAARATRDAPCGDAGHAPLILIRVEAQEPGSSGGGVLIRVTDNGPGICGADGKRMDAAEIRRIFEPGYTLRNPRRAEAAGEDAGEGLGLAWVRTIVEEIHQGRVTARNHPDSGACFEIALPRTPERD